MMLVLSGEGPTDLGCCRAPVDHCAGGDFAAGPLAIIVDQLVEPSLGYRPLQVHPASVHYVSKAALERRARDGKRRGFAFIGKKRGQETGYFYVAAWMLGDIAIELEAEHADLGIAVLHRDSDDRSDQPDGLWERKFTSMLDGFARSGHSRGVPMLPRPISEAWLLCAARPAMADCAALEDESASAKSPRPLKQQLDDALGGHRNAEAVSEWIDGAFQADKLGTMPSFARFRAVLDEAMTSAVAYVKAATAAKEDE
jgi:hypothetical protein